MKETLSVNRTFLMGLAMIGIVCFHHGWAVIPGFTAFFSRFGLWGVDIFLFLSGFGCVYALNKYNTTTFWRKRVMRLLPTCLLAGILVYCADLYFHVERTITYLPVRLLSIHRWYIQAIMICYLLCPLAYFILKKYRVTGLLFMVAIAIIINMCLPEVKVWRINWAFGRVPVFLIGMYIALFDLKMMRWHYILSGICLLVAVVTRCVGGDYAFLWAYFLAAAMPFVCETLCRLREICIRLKVYRFIEIMGICSLEIYLTHEYCYWAIPEISVPLWCRYILFLIVVSILVWGLKKAADLIVTTLKLR